MANEYFVTAVWTVFNIAIFLLLPMIIAIIIQIRLSKKENRWLGLILPSLFFVTSVVVTLVFFVLSIYTTVWSTLGVAFILFIIFNVPTAVLLIIYNVIRRARKNKKEMDRMNIQDLS